MTAEKQRPEKAGTPAKNRAWGKNGERVKFAYKIPPQALGLQQGIGPRVTETVSGRPRWLSRDPLGEEGGLNLYAMVGNDPVNKWDYLGLMKNSTGFVPPPVRPRVKRNPIKFIATTGPDITKSLKATLKSVTKKFFSLDKMKRVKACCAIENLESVGVSMIRDNGFWDISDLNLSLAIKPSELGKGSLPDGTGGINLVVFQQNTHRAYSANYALWGRMFRLCKAQADREFFLGEFEEDDAVRLVKVYKNVFQKIIVGPSIGGFGTRPVKTKEAVAFTRFGYDNRNSTRSAAITTRRVKKSSTIYLGGRPMSWVWRPIVQN